MPTRLTLALVAAVAVASCSDPLADLGHRSRDFFEMGSTPTTRPDRPVSATSIPGGVETLQGLRGIVWYNEDDPIWGAGGLRDLGSEQVVDVIWAQSSRRESFVQSSPGEIAAGLPGIEFPTLVPESVRYVSSQLVFSPATGELAEDFQAAFGLWTVVPYTESREVGQRASLWVGHADQAVTYGDLDLEQIACPELEVGDARSCRPAPVGALVGWWYVVPEGGRLVWFAGPYRYDLMLRSTDDPELPVRMAESMQPLADF